MDFEATEKLIRTAALEGAAKTLAVLFDKANDLVREQEHACPLCGRAMHRAGMRSRRVTSILGEVTQERAMYRCPCGATAYPADELLDVAGTSRSPGVRRMTARLGARESFADAAEDLRELSGISISAKDCERSSEKTGAEVAAWEEKRRGQAPDPAQSAAACGIPVLYIEMDGTGVPPSSGPKRTAARERHRTDPPKPVRPKSDASSRKPARTKRGSRCATPAAPPFPAPWKTPRPLRGASSPKPGAAAWNARKKW